MSLLQPNQSPGLQPALDLLQHHIQAIGEVLESTEDETRIAKLNANLSSCMLASSILTTPTSRLAASLFNLPVQPARRDHNE